MYHVPTVGIMQNFVVVFCLRCQFFAYFCRTKFFLRKSDEYETIGDIPPCGFDPLDGSAPRPDLSTGEEACSGTCFQTQTQTQTEAQAIETDHRFTQWLRVGRPGSQREVGDLQCRR